MADARKLIADGTISGGMIPKVETCIYALDQGVEGVVIMDGKIPHAVLLELLTDHGVGTLMHRLSRPIALAWRHDSRFDLHPCSGKRDARAGGDAGACRTDPVQSHQLSRGSGDRAGKARQCRDPRLVPHRSRRNAGKWWTARSTPTWSMCMRARRRSTAARRCRRPAMPSCAFATATSTSPMRAAAR